MSFDIFIGEETADEDFGTGVKRITLDDAPVFDNDELTGNGNSRHPGYSQWSGFTREAGLYTLFFDKRQGLMREHPGTFRLEPMHLAAIESALAGWRDRHPGTRPGFDKGQDPILARLLWLRFWVKWALENCKRPAIHNY